MWSFNNECEIDNGSLYITNFGYNVIEVECHDGSKRFIHFFPPVIGENTSNGMLPENHSRFSTISCTDHLPSVRSMIKFWQSDEEFQHDGNYKGGSWGSNNFPPTNEDWGYDGRCGMNYGDFLYVTSLIRGIIKFDFSKKGRPFTEDRYLLRNSEDTATSINFIFRGNMYSGYMCDKPSMQIANDSLVVYKTTLGRLYMRMAKRGSKGKNLDIPNKIIPGAGETLEPCEGGYCLKDETRRSLREELGIDLNGKETIYELGEISGDRDPRYNIFNLVEDEEYKIFGFKRGSKTKIILVLFEGEQPPGVLNYFDRQEISKTFWIPMSEALKIDPSMFMIPDHSLFARMANDFLFNL